MKRVLSIVCVLSLVILAAIGSEAHAQCTNLLANPGFEASGGSYDGWFTFGSGPQMSTPATDNIFRSGSAAAKIYGEFTNCPIPQFDVGGFGQAFTPVTGRVYELSGYGFVSSADPIPGTDPCNGNRLVAQVAFFDQASEGNVISRNEVIVGDGTTTLEQWKKFSVSTVAPPGALRVEALFLFLQPGCDTGSVFVDDVQFCETTEMPVANLLVNPSFDLGLTGWTTFSNVYHDTRIFATRTPIGSAKLFGPFGDPGAASGLFQTFPAAPGEAWTYSVHALTTCTEDPIYGTNDNFATAKLIFNAAGGAVLDSTEITIVDNTSPLGRWTKHRMYVTSPAGAVSVSVYVLFIQPTDQNGAIWVDDLELVKLDPTGIADGPQPIDIELHQNHPNPFNPTTTISFTLPVAQHAKVEIFDAKGARVRVLFDDMGYAGLNNVSWNGTDANGNRVASGAYFYRLTSGASKVTRKMVLLK
ncbi:MAG: T9SS type A sorting domain-containing protein [Candidatus Latescibacterota bacterium]|nr:MAG: T9SS type A sorting domain-containing protein [Candidatus Latescibacterota bacterium]